MAEYDDINTTSGNATSGRQLKRMELVYAGTSVKFAVNPEDYTQKEANLASITMTKGGAWIDAWGAGVIEITIKGITGVRGSSTDIDVGYQRWRELRNLFREVYAAVTDGETIDELIKFYNFTDNEYWYCYPSQGGIELYRSKSRPHMYQYTVNLWAVRKIGDPAPEISSGTTYDTGTISGGLPSEIGSIDDIFGTQAGGTISGGNDPNTISIGTPDRSGSPDDVFTGEAGETIGLPQKEKQSMGNPLKKYSSYINTAKKIKKAVTTIKKIAKIFGGNGYSTSKLVTDSEADRIITTNTKTKTILMIQEDCRLYASLLSRVVGGTNGKLSPVTGFNATKDVEVQPSGVVSNIEFFSGKDLMENPDRLVSEVQFTSKVSVETYNMISLIKNYSDEVLSLEYCTLPGKEPRDRLIQAIASSTAYDSSIYVMIKDYSPIMVLNKLEVKRLKLILLESMMVYIELYRMYLQSGTLSTNLTAANMTILINNIRAMIMYFTLVYNDTNVFERQNVRSELRRLEKIMTQVLADVVDYL